MNGVVYTAIGPDYIDQAKVSIRSLRRWSPELRVAVFSDNPAAFDDCADVTRSSAPMEAAREQRMLPRLLNLLDSPFDRTLSLDTDTVVMGDLTDLFSTLDTVSVGICHGHQRSRRFSAALRDKKADPSIPYGFAPVQGGVILFDGFWGREFMSEVVDLYRSKAYIDDQVSMREVLWRADYRFSFLPPEYNIWDIDILDSWAATGFDQAWPKIFHTVTLKFLLSPDEADRVLLPLAHAADELRTRALAEGGSSPVGVLSPRGGLGSRLDDLKRWRARRRLLGRIES